MGRRGAPASGNMAENPTRGPPDSLPNAHAVAAPKIAKISFYTRKRIRMELKLLLLAAPLSISMHFRT
jgi:hypothetical protein